MPKASAAHRAALGRRPAALAAVLAAQPEAELSQRTERGQEVHVARYRGVVFEERVRRGRGETFVMDSSDHGAVLCTWMIYITLRAQLSVRNPGQQAELREDFDWAIGALNAFIAENDPNREPLLSWQERAAVADDRCQQQLRSNLQLCRNPDGATFVISFLGQPREARRRWVTEQLSVPRPPAAAPCL